MKKTATLAVAVAAFALAVLSSCEKEMLKSGSSDRYVTFEPVLEKALDIYCGTRSSSLASEDGCMSLPLTCHVTEGIDVAALDSTKTRGALCDNAAGLQSIGTFTTQGYYADGTAGSVVTVNYNGSSKWVGTPRVMWKEGMKEFYAYANFPSSGCTITNLLSERKFSYTVPTNVYDQKDILTGYYKGNEKSDNGTAKIKFTHPLTAVIFKLGTVYFTPGELSDGHEIKSITLRNVYSGGDCTISYDNDKATYSWTSTGSQNVTMSSSPSTDSETKIIGEPFLILPQNTSEQNVTIELVADVEGRIEVYRTTVNAIYWKEGNTYTYTIAIL